MQLNAMFFFSEKESVDWQLIYLLFSACYPLSTLIQAQCDRNSSANAIMLPEKKNSTWQIWPVLDCHQLFFNHLGIFLTLLEHFGSPPSFNFI